MENVFMNWSVSLDISNVIAPVAPEIYGGFVEHLGRNVYGGIFDPTDPMADEDGFRKDVLLAIQELGTPVTRYPGGCFTDTWHWEEGIGPRERRFARLDYAWKQNEPNTFGIDEFMKWAEKAGTEPVITINLSTSGILEAADLFEYCNVPSGTRYSDLRRKNGRAKPYNVRYWCLGNEIYGSWEIGQRPAAEYGRLARETAKMLKRYDPSLKMILCGCNYDQQWNRTVLEEAYEYIDLLSLHETFNIKRWSTEEFICRTDAFEESLQCNWQLCESVKTMKKATNEVALSIDEWIVWDENQREMPKERWSSGRHMLEQDFTMLEAALTGQLFSMFHNNADIVKLACVAQSVNVIAPIRTAPGGKLWKQTTFYPFSLTSRYGRGSALRLNQPPEQRKDFYMSAIWNSTRSELVLFLTSRNLVEPVAFECSVSGRQTAGKPTGVTLATLDWCTVNTQDAATVVPRSFQGLVLKDNTISGVLEPGSWNMIRLPCE